MQALLAQVQNGGADEAETIGMIVGICGCLSVLLIVIIFFLLTLQKALSRCGRHNRTMEPGMVWLNLIPLFNIVWQFITVARVAESLKNEFRSRGWHRGEDYGNGVGMASCALRLCGIIPLLGPFLSLAGFICGIVYWVKIANYSSQLATRASYEDDYEDYDDDDGDDRDRRPRRDRDDDDGDDDRREGRGRR